MYSQDIYDVGIYCRLSRDDNNGNLESMSIANQRQMLMDYVKEKGWNLRETYIDDGWSGTNFDRPDFKRMLRDVESGKINCIVTKDLSRFGRNYVKTGYYTEEYFVEMGVRFIAVNDSIDTIHESNDIAPFQNILNEWYPKDISKKVRQVKKSSALQGKFMGSQAPYGYMKSPENKHVLLIDEYAAGIVRRIFREFCAGDSARMIGDRLTAEQIDSPRFYNSKRPGGQTPKPNEVNNWGSTTVIQLMKNQVYIGNMVQGKRQVISFKTKKRRAVDPSRWIIVENTHEPVIDRVTWDTVQRRLNRGGHRVRKTKSDKLPDLSTFSGILICADCGSKLAYKSLMLKDGSMIGKYVCSRYNNGGKSACSVHHIQESALIAFVLNDIRLHATLAAADRGRISRRLIDAVSKSKSGEGKQLESRKQELESRQAAISSTIKSLYEDKCSGKLPETVFLSLLSDYTREQSGLGEKLQTLRSQLAEQQDAQCNVDEWLCLIASYMEITELDRPTVMALIETITIGEAVKKDGHRVQEISIQYRFIGNLLADAKEDTA